MPNENTPKKIYESGHAKLLESLTRLVAFDETLDQTRLDPPSDLTVAALTALRDNAAAAQNEVGNARADWRTIALDRATDIDKFASLASQTVAQLGARGASKETVKDGMSYVRKLQGKRAKPKPEDDPETPEFDESEKGISASQQSSAAKLGTMFEFIDFVEAQPQSADIKTAGLTVADLRSFAQATQTKHNASIVAATALTNKRGSRNGLFYLDENNACDLAKRFKALVRGEYGANSFEFKTVNAIPFKKPKL